MGKYTNSPNYITYHELGKDGVQVASLFYGFVTKGKKLEEAVEKSGETIGKREEKIFQMMITLIMVEVVESQMGMVEMGNLAVEEKPG